MLSSPPDGQAAAGIPIPGGLSAVEFGIYTRLVARPSMTDTEIADTTTGLGGRAEEGPAVLDRLRRLGLVTAHPEDPTRHVATPPTTALDATLAARSRSLARARRQMRHLATRHDRRGDDSDALVEVVRGPAAVARAINHVSQSTRHEFVAFDAPPYSGDPLAGNIWPGDPPRHDLPFRVIYDPKSIELPERRTELFGRVWTAEQQIRVAATPMKMAVADGRTAVIPLDQDTSPGEAVLLIHDTGLLAALAALFETYWARAVPLHLRAGDTEHPEAAGLSDSDGELLFLLVAGFTDKAIATQLGWTDRTVRRRTSDMLRILGAETRFQAGYQAVAHGWLNTRNTGPEGSHPR